MQLYDNVIKTCGYPHLDQKHEPPRTTASAVDIIQHMSRVRRDTVPCDNSCADSLSQIPGVLGVRDEEACGQGIQIRGGIGATAAWRIQHEAHEPGGEDGGGAASGGVAGSVRRCEGRTLHVLELQGNNTRASVQRLLVQSPACGGFPVVESSSRAVVVG